jgi:hypothetical protein
MAGGIMHLLGPKRHTLRHFRFVAPLGFVFVFAASGCGPMGPYRAQATDTWTRSYPLTKTGEVSIQNVNGKVEVEGTDGSTVEVSAERIARGATDRLANELLPRISISEYATPDSVSIETQKLVGILIGASFEVRYHVKAPKTARIRATTVNGGIEAKSVDGRLIVRTTNGGVVVAGIRGGLEARTVNGGVRAMLASTGNGDVTLSTVNGGVRLVLPDTAKATVDATWVNGGISMSGLKFEVRDESRRHFEGLLNGGGTPISLHTVNGGVTLASNGEDFTQK